MPSTGPAYPHITAAQSAASACAVRVAIRIYERVNLSRCSHSVQKPVGLKQVSHLPSYLLKLLRYVGTFNKLANGQKATRLFNYKMAAPRGHEQQSRVTPKIAERSLALELMHASQMLSGARRALCACAQTLFTRRSRALEADV